MADLLALLPDLIEQGEKFTFANFSSKGTRGYPNAYSEEWLVWTFYAGGIAEQFGKATPMGKSISNGLKSELLGNDEDDFQSARSQILSGLRAVHRLEAKPVPASDRVVSLGHNSPEQKQALAKVTELIEAVEQANEFPGDADDKELMLAELSAGRRLLQAANVRVTALRETLQPALKWIAEKSAGAAIGKLAGDLVEYLMLLKFW